MDFEMFMVNSQFFISFFYVAGTIERQHKVKQRLKNMETGLAKLALQD